MIKFVNIDDKNIKITLTYTEDLDGTIYLKIILQNVFDEDLDHEDDFVDYKLTVERKTSETTLKHLKEMLTNEPDTFVSLLINDIFH